MRVEGGRNVAKGQGSFAVKVQKCEVCPLTSASLRSLL